MEGSKNYLAVNINNLEYKSDEERVLSNFTTEEQKEIVQKQKILSSIAYFIGKDFNMPVLLNESGQGWHWNFAQNYIKIDPKDLLEKPMDYLRFVIAHEGGHRRVSRTEFIQKEILQAPGFLTMMNCIEDPRMNNFVADAYPVFKEQMIFSYDLGEKEREEMLQDSKEKLGFIPKHELAGLEYIRQWFKEVKNEDFDIDDRLPIEVQNVVKQTLKDAQKSWKVYPSKGEADGKEEINFKGKKITGEQAIVEFSKKSYEINLQKIWPLYKTLIDSDINDAKMSEFLEDLKKELQEMMDKNDTGENSQDSQEENGEKQKQEDKSNLQDLLDNLSDKEQDYFVEKLKESLENEEKQQKGDRVNLDDLPDSLKEKIEQMINSLDDESKKKLQVKAEKSLDEASKDFAQKLQQDNVAEKETEGTKDEILDLSKIEKSKKEQLDTKDQKDIEEIKRNIESILGNPKNHYLETMQEVLPIINQLEDDLREVFTERRSRGWQSGYKSGRKIDIARRIQEKAKDINVFESTAWKKREAPTEQDYAITLLVDLSGSMQGDKIEETFKAVVVLSEVLNKLSLNIEILGFNDRIHSYQEYGHDINDDTRYLMSDMVDEVDHDTAKGNPSYNDDG